MATKLKGNKNVKKGKMHEAVVVIQVNNSNGWHQQLMKRGVLIPHVLWRDSRPNSPASLRRMREREAK